MILFLIMGILGKKTLVRQKGLMIKTKNADTTSRSDPSHEVTERPEVVAKKENKAVYTATEVACGWAGAVIKKVIQVIGQEQQCKNRP